MVLLDSGLFVGIFTLQAETAQDGLGTGYFTVRGLGRRRPTVTTGFGLKLALVASFGHCGKRRDATTMLMIVMMVHGCFSKGKRAPEHLLGRFIGVGPHPGLEHAAHLRRPGAHVTMVTERMKPP